MVFKKIQFWILLLCSYFVHAQENFEYTFEYTWKKRPMNMPKLYTDRMKLRLLEMQDAQALFDIIQDPIITHYSYMITLHESLDDTQKWIERVLNLHAKDTCLPYVVLDAQTDEILGCCFAWYQAAHARMEVGYFYKKSSWGHGYATEALQALLQFLCTSTNCMRIQATCDPENKASAKVLQKAGMEYEGLLRNYSCVHKKPANRCMYALIPE